MDCDNNNQNNRESTIRNKIKYAVICVLMVGVILTGTLIYFDYTKPYAVAADGAEIEQVWAVVIGSEEAYYVESPEDGQAVIDGIKNQYINDNYDVESVELDPQITVKEKNLLRGEDIINCVTPKYAIEKIITGNTEKVTYKVKAGDTVSQIANDNDFTVAELEDMNPDLNIDKIQIDDVINLYQLQPLVDVTVQAKVTTTETIDYKTKYIKSSELYEGETKVKTKGKNGKRKVTKDITLVNGQVETSDVLSSKVIKKSTTQVVYKGTKVKNSGSNVIAYASQFLGNPYVWGGTSLTNGADCSGFILSVYAHFGISLPHSSWSMENCGREVSLSEAQPGDIVCYGSHVALYTGNGGIIHASSPSTGIITGTATYRPIVTIRRVLN